MNIEWCDTLDTIFAGILIGGIDSDSEDLVTKRNVFKMCLPLFKGRFPRNIFEDVYAIYYDILYNMDIAVFTKEQLEIILDNNQDTIINSTVIDFNALLGTIDGLVERAADVDKYLVFKELLTEKYIELSNKVVTVEEFKSSCALFVELYRHQATLDLVSDMAIILTEGKTIKNFKGRSVKYKGIEGAQKYYQEMMTVIDEVKETENKSSIVVDEAWLEKELKKSTNGDELRLMDFGIKEIDDAIKYIRRTHMIGILGPPKGGKTRTAAYLASRALALGLNVCVWPLEGHETEWEAMIISNIVKLITGGSTGVEIGSSDIVTETYNPAYKQLVIAAKTQLAIGKDRGKLSFIKESANVEDFLDVLHYHYENDNAYDLLIIDSMVHLTSTRGMGKAERISEGYEKLKNFISFGLPNPCAAILPAQLKQDVVDWLRKNPNETIDVTAGGESAATIRSPDHVIGVFASKQERNSGIQKFYSVASRHNGTFDDFYARCALGCCYYESDPSLNTN